MMKLRWHSQSIPSTFDEKFNLSYQYKNGRAIIKGMLPKNFSSSVLALSSSPITTSHKNYRFSFSSFGAFIIELSDGKERYVIHSFGRKIEKFYWIVDNSVEQSEILERSA